MKESYNIKTWRCINNDNLYYIDEVVSFLNNEYLSKEANPIWSKEYFQWKIGLANPAGKGYMSIALVENRVVGVATLNLKRARVNETDLVIGEMGDCYTSISAIRNCRPHDFTANDNNPNSYVNKSIFGRLVHELRSRAESDGISVIFGTPNSKAYPGWVNKLNYFEYQGIDNYFYVRPTFNFFIKKFPLFRSFKKIINILENLIMTFSSIFNFKFTKYKVLHGNPTDEELDLLASLESFLIGFKIIKDSTYIRYRFIQHPFANYDFFRIYNQNKLKGMIITRVLMNDNGEKKLAIVEYFGKAEIVLQPIIIQKIINHFSNFLLEKIFLFSSKNSKSTVMLKKSFFLKTSKIPIIFANNPENDISKNTKFEDFELQLGDTDAI